MSLKFIKTFLLILLSSITLKGSPLQDIQISGKVTSFNWFPLQNASVKSLKSGIVTLTDSLGNFAISCTAKDILQVSASGFKEKKIRINKPGPLKIDLAYRNDGSSFDDAVAGGHISREMLENAIKTMRLKGEKDYSRYRDIYELIKDEIYNVRVVGTEVYGTRNLSITEPPVVLYDVDGMIVTDISYVLPVYVKKIEYLDGVAAAPYGIRGANGVIKITLKK